MQDTAELIKLDATAHEWQTALITVGAVKWYQAQM